MTLYGPRNMILYMNCNDVTLGKAQLKSKKRCHVGIVALSTTLAHGEARPRIHVHYRVGVVAQ